MCLLKSMKDISNLLNFGIINIDKSAGPTSFSVSEFVKRKLKLKKTSHMGTLDPKVTGVLPITLGRACKLASWIISHDKKYVGILETHKECDITQLQDIIDKHFVGAIQQTPPHRSAVKRQSRSRTVYIWKLLEAREDNRSFLFEAMVEGGTYIRKLCSDLGELIGGGHMGELRRTGAGIFSEYQETIAAKLVQLDEFEEAVNEMRDGNEDKIREIVIPAETVIKKILPVVRVDKSALKSLWVGRPLLLSNVCQNKDFTLKVKKIETGDTFAAFCEDAFVGIYQKSNEESIFARPEFVYN